MWSRVAILLEMIKFSHTVFALPFALLAAALAFSREGFRWLDLVGILACMVFARSAAMAFNRWADRDVDAANPRTATRAIPAGQLTPGQVLLFVVACSLGFLASTGIFLASSGNPLPLALGPIVLAFLFGYSYAKRWTSFAHVWLGTALAFSPIAAWIAIRGTVEWEPVFLGLAIVCWVTGFDILYALQDLEADRELGLHSIPAKFGFERAMWIARASHVAMAIPLTALGFRAPELGMFYFVGVVAVVGLLAYEHWLVRGRDLLRINLAFLNVNGVISVGLFAATLLDLATRTS